VQNAIAANCSASLARSLDAQVKAVATTVETAAHDLVDTARSMQQVSESATQEAGKANGVSRVAAEHVSGGWRIDEPARQRDRRDRLSGAGILEISQDAVTQIAEANRPSCARCRTPPPRSARWWH